MALVPSSPLLTFCLFFPGGGEIVNLEELFCGSRERVVGSSSEEISPRRSNLVA